MVFGFSACTEGQKDGGAMCVKKVVLCRQSQVQTQTRGLSRSLLAILYTRQGSFPQQPVTGVGSITFTSIVTLAVSSTSTWTLSHTAARRKLTIITSL